VRVLSMSMRYGVLQSVCVGNVLHYYHYYRIGQERADCGTTGEQADNIGRDWAWVGVMSVAFVIMLDGRSGCGGVGRVGRTQPQKSPSWISSLVQP